MSYAIDRSDMGDYVLTDYSESFEFTTSDLAAAITSEFDEADNTVELTIEQQWFTRKDIKELREFLKQLSRGMKAAESDE